LRDIERLLKREITVKAVAGFEVDPRIKAEPIENGRRSQGARNAGGSGQRKPPQRPAPASSGSKPAGNSARRPARGRNAERSGAERSRTP